MSGQYWFSLFAVAQGALLFGFVFFIFGYYVPKKKSQIKNNLRWHVIFVSASYMIFIGCVIQSAAYQFYDWGSVWYWMALTGFLLGDLSLIFIFREISKRDYLEKYQKKNEKNN